MKSLKSDDVLPTEAERNIHRWTTWNKCIGDSLGQHYLLCYLVCFNHHTIREYWQLFFLIIALPCIPWNKRSMWFSSYFQWKIEIGFLWNSRHVLWNLIDNFSKLSWNLQDLFYYLHCFSVLVLSGSEQIGLTFQSVSEWFWPSLISIRSDFSFISRSITL